MLLFLAPWAALVAALALIYEIALLLGSSRRGALAASLVTASFPIVLLQTFSYQGDIFVATLTLSSVFFVLLFIKDKNPWRLYLSGLAIAIAIGSKQTAFLFVPIYGLSLLILLVMKTISWQLLVRTVCVTAAFFVIFSSLKMIQNLSEEKIDRAYMVSPDYYNNLLTSTKRPFKVYAVNSLRYFYQSIDLNGFVGKFRINSENTKEAVFRFFTEKIGLDIESDEYTSSNVTSTFRYANRYAINEDSSWFGPLFYPLFLAGIIVVLVKNNKLSKGYLFLALILMVIFALGQVVLKTTWGPNRGRHMAVAVLTFAPLTAFLIPQKKILGGVMALSMAFLSIYFASTVLLFNDSRPLVGQTTLVVFSEDYLAKIKVTNIFNSQYRKRLMDLSTGLSLTAPSRATILESSYNEKLFFQSLSEIKNIDFINQWIAEDQPIYLLMDSTFIEYALFGKNKTRDLYPVTGLNEMAKDSYILISTEKDLDLTGFLFIAENETYQIYYKP
jgi:4-amino-4-deoxy-L-arabinose transferase-like glycosyltransferase